MPKIKLLLTLPLLIALPACTTPRPNHVQRLMAHPQFQAVKTAAPAWARDALTTINNLQLELAKAQSK